MDGSKLCFLKIPHKIVFWRSVKFHHRSGLWPKFVRCFLRRRSVFFSFVATDVAQGNSARPVAMIFLRHYLSNPITCFFSLSRLSGALFLWVSTTCICPQFTLGHLFQFLSLFSHIRGALSPVVWCSQLFWGGSVRAIIGVRSQTTYSYGDDECEMMVNVWRWRMGVQ